VLTIVVEMVGMGVLVAVCIISLDSPVPPPINHGADGFPLTPNLFNNSTTLEGMRQPLKVFFFCVFVWLFGLVLFV
jgi:hypothetical protein